ncbi:hypothetical protein ACFQFC_40390 [Amorphoplanes digitatis]|uniref:Uncharacterized protein n=1 Tax=Actinoplanes digitatis TaxID=1868 RepID=A0A7W7HX62_9ACTN|nr:hypothetical protein [Actinoplanes digitatis]MBB4762433.1 hypothetical protein [Actinoplanes digitatis]BFE71260.1 hypothetical protein GCM10020092_045610 [Actinoplanes digitatis]GID92443.1 hypothetical protein Adi01nite_18550 [Actinoplanes digitatis]
MIIAEVGPHMVSRWRREVSRADQIMEALQRAPEAIDVRGARRWRWADEHWRDWLRRSGTAMELFTRRNESDEYRYLLGADAYRDQLVEALSRARPRDCAAAGFGCTRRIDRACRGPEICSRDRAEAPDDRTHREGPLPGACDSFYLDLGEGRAWIGFSAGDRHRAVLWWENTSSGMLWIDGTRVGGDQTLDTSGRWLDDRFYTVQAEGPEDHPAQEYGMGSLSSRIRSLLLHDADRSSTRLLTPTPDELWTDPRIVRSGESLLVHARPDDIRTGTPPTRILPTG